MLLEVDTLGLGKVADFAEGNARCCGDHFQVDRVGVHVAPARRALPLQAFATCGRGYGCYRNKLAISDAPMPNSTVVQNHGIMLISILPCAVHAAQWPLGL